MAAGGTSILEAQRRMTCGAYVQVGAGAWGAEGSVDSPGMLLLRSYGCLFLVLIWLVRNSLGGGGLPGTSAAFTLGPNTAKPRLLLSLRV